MAPAGAAAAASRTRCRDESNEHRDSDPNTLPTRCAQPVPTGNPVPAVCTTDQPGPQDDSQVARMAATTLLETGVPLEVISKVLGHASIPASDQQFPQRARRDSNPQPFDP